MTSLLASSLFHKSNVSPFKFSTSFVLVSSLVRRQDLDVITMLVPIALLISSLFATVQASIYVTNPVQSTVCTGGQSCEVDWVDNGESPLLSDIGECTVGLYSGEMAFVQSLPSVDVSSTSTLSFTPNPSAGPNGQYYIVFTSSAISYQGFSASFTLSGMTGTTVGGGTSSTPPASNATTTSSASGASSASSTGTATGTATGTTTATTPATTVSTTVTTATPVVTTSGTNTLTVTPTTTFTTATTSTSTPSPTTTNAAIRAGSSGSLAAALFLACAGALVF
ncbi:hypothetical protein F5J12DRAFT_848394 [Pisolithus orientalis]|uniref:uncharacterized protein n=1 Tax=Pisolithus orientalis TaxID=936130 RepID=UPI0022240789|nr:uncharacterized protein F5J12DRAFT_848394 [Pisolithus orientalis]KAI5998936.1 hypothetical protein F5J12DRAFT_848394 [Pisolithus orientalis]